MKVTYIDKDPYYESLYQQLFADAAEELGLAQITDMVTYFSYIDQLRKSGKYKFIRLPVTEDYFMVDLDKREIVVPEVFEKNGIGVQGDSMAEVLYFKVSRYFDDIDLSTCLPTETGDKKGMCFIQWENSKGEQGLDPVQFADIENNDLIFGWPLHDAVMDAFKEGKATGTGTVKFSIRFEYHENEKMDSEIIFSLHTLPASCKIHANLVDLTKTINVEDITDQINKRPAFSGIYDSTLGPKAYFDPNGDLPNYADLDPVTGEVVLSVSASGTGTLHYVWNVNGKHDETADDQTSYTATSVGRYMVQVGNEYNNGNIRWTDSNTTEIVEASEIEFVQNLVAQGYADGITELKVEINVLDDPRGTPNGIQTYTWYRDDQIVHTEAAEAGVRTATYTPSIDTPGMYRVEVVNQFNKDDSVVIVSEKSELKAPVRAPEKVDIAYDADTNTLTATVTTDFDNDLYYAWINTTNPGRFETSEPTFVPTTNGSYSCQVYQHTFIGVGDLEQKSGFTASPYVEVTNAQ